MSEPPVMTVGELVRVSFLDHCVGADELEPMACLGRVAKVTEEKVTLDWWYYDARAERDHNCESVTLVRAAIRGVVRLAPAPA